MSPREPGATAAAALERSLLPLPQCTGRRRRQHHRPPRGLQRRLRGRRARGALEAAPGESQSDGDAPAGRPRLRRRAPPRPAALPCARRRQPGRFLVHAGGSAGEVRPPHRRGATTPRARHGRVRALHKGRAPRGCGRGRRRPQRRLSGGGREGLGRHPLSEHFQTPGPACLSPAEAPSSFGL